MRTYGGLHLLQGGQMWEISKLEPHVAIRLKQLFPRVPKESAGPFHLRHDHITDADLEWFLRRYPLRISNKDKRALSAGRSAFNAQQAELERILLPNYAPHRSSAYATVRKFATTNNRRLSWCVYGKASS